MNRENTDRTIVGARITIYPRGKRKIFYADFHFGGQHRRRSLKTTVKRLAVKKALQLENKLEGGSMDVPDSKNRQFETRATITKTIDAFIEYHKTEGSRRKTVVKYKGILNRFADFATTSDVTLLDDVNLLLVDKYRANRQEHLSAKSMHHEGSLLKSFFAWSVERGLMPNNPLEKRKFKPPAPKPRGGPTLEQINTILETASDIRRTVIGVAAFAGVRIGEVTRLTVEDVDFEQNWLRIRSRPGYETKSGQDWKVPLHSRLRKMLEQVPHRDTGWFFNSQPSNKYPHGDHHINSKHVSEDFTKILKSLGISSGRVDGFTFHSLRSSFKTICINAGVPKEVVDIWQNHAPDRAASHNYYKLSDEESQRFMRLVPFGD